MNYRDILKLKSDVTTKVEGSSVVDSNETNTKIFEAFRMLMSNILPRSLRRVSTLKNAFSEDTNIYKLPDDVEEVEYVRIKSDKDKYGINDFNFNRVRSKTIGQNQLELEYGIDYINGERVLVIDANHIKTNKYVVEDYSDLTDVSTTNVDSIEKEYDNTLSDNSIKINLDTTTHEATIDSNFAVNKDIAQYIRGDVSFNLDINFENIDVIDYVYLYISDGISNYTLTKYDNLYSNRFEVGDNKLNFRINRNSKVDLSKLSVVKVIIGYNKLNQVLTDEVNNIVIDGLTATNGHNLEISYISNAPFFNIETKTYSNEPVSDEDKIELDDSAYVILLNELAHLLSIELQGEDAVFNQTVYSKKLEGGGRNIGLYKQYKGKHRDNSQRIREMYYEPNTNPNSFNNMNIS